MLDMRTVVGPRSGFRNRRGLRSWVLTWAAASAACGLASAGTAADVVGADPQLSACMRQGSTVVRWVVPPDDNTIGCYLEKRAADGTGSGAAWGRVTADLVPVPLEAVSGAVLEADDPRAREGERCTYRVVRMDRRGRETLRGPYTVTVAGRPEAPPAVAAVPADGLLPHAAIPAPGITGAASEGTSRVRVTLRERGLYAVAATNMAAVLQRTEAEIRALLAGRQLRLHGQGRDVAWLPAPAGDALLFYGEPFASLYTDSNCYWIDVAAGPVMTDMSGAAGTGVEPLGRTFSDTLEFEENLVALNTSFLDPEADFWVWQFQRILKSPVPSLLFPLLVPGVDTNASVALDLRLVGNTDFASAPDQHVVVSLNGRRIGETWWDGFGPTSVTFTCAAGWLRPGTNDLSVQGVFDMGVVAQYWGLDTVSITYPRFYTAENDQLFCKADGHDRITVRGFSSADILVLDVTASHRPRLVTGAQIALDGTAHRVTFAAVTNAVYFVAARGATRNPVAVQGAGPVVLRAAANAADYLLVTHASLWGGATVLRDYREAQGLNVLMTDIQQVYDEFNDGIADPHALHDCLDFAYRRWAKAPRYVLLAGNGSFDFRNYLGYGECLIPPLLVGTASGLRETDYPYADVDDDGLPEMAVGRLAVMRAADLVGLRAKIATYEAGGAWTNTVLVATDNPDAGGPFDIDGDNAAALVGEPARVVKAYLTNSVNVASTRASMLATLKAGCSLFVYVGHAGFNELAEEKLLTTTDVPALTNGNRAAFAVLAACATGRFAQPNQTTLAEALSVSTNGGAVAALASASATYNSDNGALGTEVTRALYETRLARLGDAVGAALVVCGLAGGMPLAQRAWNLLGDPATAFGGARLGLQPGSPYGAAGAVGFAEWQRLHFLPVERAQGLAAAGADPDGDGFKNAGEHGAGTHPRDAGDLLHIGSVRSAPGGGLVLTWQSVTNKVYALGAATLRPDAFQSLGAAIPATPPLNVHTVSVSRLAPPRGFFRVQVAP